MIKIFRSLSLVITLSAFSIPSFSQAATEFKSIDLFLQFIKAETITFAVGDLFGRTGMDWAGIVASKDQSDEKILQIYLLEKLPSGNFLLIEKSAPRPAFGGTGNFGYGGISISNKSVFVEFSYHWHSCFGNSTSQFKQTKNGWQLVGIESFESNITDGSAKEVNTSSNFLTDRAIIEKTINEKHKTSKIKMAPKLILLKDYNGDGTISIHEKRPIC